MDRRCDHIKVFPNDLQRSGNLNPSNIGTEQSRHNISPRFSLALGDVFEALAERGGPAIVIMSRSGILLNQILRALQAPFFSIHLLLRRLAPGFNPVGNTRDITISLEKRSQAMAAKRPSRAGAAALFRVRNIYVHTNRRHVLDRRPNRLHHILQMVDRSLAIEHQPFLDKARILLDFRFEHHIQFFGSFFKNRCLVIRYDSHSDSPVHLHQ
ncbi:hypothetical protein SAMD00020551_2930 [Mesobacillus selenatarsenatis SF-1]|uniref:Uncharacterized protein n=1 Tax=Mesobacillus selenatarsenatis (strain DSM 18680 / JCM 14380 / FERM P-15431 / SF-1) TaxID=1321606 RepID=A0A0A8X9F0_MESS1|nr:hypothetical protein SAMD00020551_2930 [Mesobacillus selenatarsenatis SF-1]